MISHFSHYYYCSRFECKITMNIIRTKTLERLKFLKIKLEHWSKEIASSPTEIDEKCSLNSFTS